MANRKKSETTAKTKRTPKPIVPDEIEETSVIEAEETVAETAKTEAKEEKTEATFTKDQVDALIQAAVKEAIANAPKTVYKSEEYVTLMFTGVMAQGCVVSLGQLGQINRNFGTIDVPKRDFLQHTDYRVDRLLQTRRVIVIDGLTEDERERFNLNYKEGELLSERVYRKLFDLPKDEITEIFEKLCFSHQKVVAKMYITAYEDGDNRIGMETVKALNDISKKNFPAGLFTPILESMGEKLGL